MRSELFVTLRALREKFQCAVDGGGFHSTGDAGPASRSVSPVRGSQLEGPGAVFDLNAPKASLPECTDPIMPGVEPSAVTGVELLHSATEIGVGSLDNEMMVVSH